MEIKIEHNKVNKGAKTALGVMLELTAPAAPVREADLARKAKSIVFVVDRSGSMGGGRLEMVKNTILDTLARLNQDDHLSVVTFDDDAVIEVPLTRIGELNIAQVRDKIAALQTGGSTNLELGYRFGLAQAANSPEGVEATVILLSDGHANAGVVDPDSLGQLATAAIEHYVTTTTLGIGEGYDERILDSMADCGNGNHVAALELAEAVDALQAQIDDLLMKTMTDVKVRIDFAPTFFYKNGSIRKVKHMRKFRTTETGCVAELGDLSSLEEKNFVFELTLDARDKAELGLQEGFTIKWSYVDPTVNQLIEGETTFEIEVVDAQEWVEPSRNEDIVAELKSIRMQDVRDEALNLYMNGREAEADELLRAAGADLDEFMRTSQELSPRARSRLYSSSTEFSTFAMMSDSNEKQKRIREMRNRAKNDKPDFREKP